MNNIRKNGVTAALDFAILALPASAYAELKPSAALQSACRADAFKLCSTSLFSMDSVVACLRAKKSQASQRCQAQYDAEFEILNRKRLHRSKRPCKRLSRSRYLDAFLPSTERWPPALADAVRN